MPADHMTAGELTATTPATSAEPSPTYPRQMSAFSSNAAM
jgi:hypothetical protein